MKTSFIGFILAITSCINADAQNVMQVQHTQSYIDYKPKGFYLSEAVDGRANKGAIGSSSSGKDKMAIELLNGAQNFLEYIITHNITHNQDVQAISLHLEDMDVNIKKNGDAWKGTASIALAFYINDKMLVTYKGQGTTDRNPDPAAYIDQFIQQSIGRDLQAFDEWWAKNKDRVPVNNTVKVNVSIGRTPETKDNIILYTNARSLTIADFQGKVKDTYQEQAATASGIGFSYNGETQKGQIVINVIVAPYFDKDDSWFKRSEGDAVVLAHEQTHFDISALKACELVNTIRNTPFTQENYADLLKQLHDQALEALWKEEEQYDNETQHGIITPQQQDWQNKIKAELKKSGCY